MTAAAMRHQEKRLGSCQPQSSQHHISEWIVLRHWVTMINAVALKLSFQGLTRRCDRPDVLRPTVALLTAYQPATETFTKQVQRSVPGEYADLIAKRFSHSRRSRGREAEVPRVTLVLRIAAIARRFRPIFDLRRRQHRSVIKRPFRIERLTGHALYEHNAKSPAGATGIGIERLFAVRKAAAKRERSFCRITRQSERVPMSQLGGSVTANELLQRLLESSKQPTERHLRSRRSEGIRACGSLQLTFIWGHPRSRDAPSRPLLEESGRCLSLRKPPAKGPATVGSGRLKTTLATLRRGPQYHACLGPVRAAYSCSATVSLARASSSDEKTRFTSRMMMNSSPRFPIPWMNSVRQRIAIRGGGSIEPGSSSITS